MSKDHTKLEVINESPKESTKTSRPLDLNTLEMVFGTPNSPKTDMKPDVHLIKNEKNHGKDTHVNNDVLSQPLLEPEKDRPQPPLAGPEIDDLDDEVNKSTDVLPYPGIDDGLLDIDDDGEKKPNGEHDPNFEKDGTQHKEGDDASTDDGKWPLSHGDDEADYPLYDANGLSPRFGIDDRPGSPMLPPGSIPDVNTYQQKKNLAQGMMDLALLSANANQLRYVLESSGAHPYYYPSLSLIAISIIIQIAVGVGLIMNSRYNVKDEKDICKADKINNMTVLGIFLITIVNVFITSFSVATPTTTVGGSGAALPAPIQRPAT